MNLKLSRDINGNKTLGATFGDEGGFSVQTLGSLPRTHRMFSDTFGGDHAHLELLNYIEEFGTDRQKRLLNLCRP